MRAQPGGVVIPSVRGSGRTYTSLPMDILRTGTAVKAMHHSHLKAFDLHRRTIRREMPQDVDEALSFSSKRPVLFTREEEISSSSVPY